MLEKLRTFIGEEFNVDDIICAFEDTGDVPVIVSRSHNDGYDYAVYLDEPESECYGIKLDANNIITDVF